MNEIKDNEKKTAKMLFLADEQKLINLVIEEYDGEANNDIFQGFGRLTYRNGNVYHGEFQSGMMFGKGKYCWKTGETYEGDMINNEINGSGCYRWPNKNYYEGDVFKGKRNGFGSFSTNYGVSYSGEWCNGKREGKGKILYDSDGNSFYEGDWINNKPHGWGIRRYSSGNFYEGMWIDGIREGLGTMRWNNKNQIYIGQWKKNKQDGIGEQHWYLTRIDSSQYALRNSYYGEFTNGKRQGNGTFLYANGSKYQGYWFNNMKNGFGQITLKNGTSFEVYFEKDKLINQKFSEGQIIAPLNIGSVLSEELNDIDIDNIKLDFDELLSYIPISKQITEKKQAIKTVLRFIDTIRKIYRFYSQLGYDSSPDNTYTLNKMHLWRFMKDCKFHHYKFTLAQLDRILNDKSTNSISNQRFKKNESYAPFDKILLRDFLNHLLILSYHLYKDDVNETEITISSCFEILMNNIKKFACNIQGFIYNDNRKVFYVSKHILQCFEVFKIECLKKNSSLNSLTMKMKDFMKMLNEYNLMNSNLTTQDIIKILSHDDPNVQESESCLNLELEMTFLEFFEALIGCATKYMTHSTLQESVTPRASTIITREQSFLSDDSSHSNNERKLSKIPFDKQQKTFLKHSDINDECVNIHNELESSNYNDNKNMTDIIVVKKIKTNDIKKINEVEKEFQNWIQKIDSFFNLHFFPEFNKYRNLEKLKNFQ